MWKEGHKIAYGRAIVWYRVTWVDLKGLISFSSFCLQLQTDSHKVFSYSVASGTLYRLDLLFSVVQWNSIEILSSRILILQFCGHRTFKNKIWINSLALFWELAFWNDVGASSVANIWFFYLNPVVLKSLSFQLVMIIVLLHILRSLYLRLSWIYSYLFIDSF